MTQTSVFLKLAQKAAKAAAKIHKKYYKTKLAITTKSTHFDRVTIADLESEKKIVSIIKKQFPDHNILAEENKYSATDSPYTWIIDPLDGTINFSHSFPIFSVSIALAYNGEIIVGVVYDPSRSEMFYAQKGKGAFLNGKPIHVTSVDHLKAALLITGFYYARDERMVRTLEDIKSFLIAGIIGIRRLGSAALDLCNVASGRADGYWEFYLSPWDYAAGLLILTEAGGRVTDKNNGPVDIYKPSYIVSSNDLIHEKILEVLNK